MADNDNITVLDEGVEDEIDELATCCKAGAPTKFQPAK